MKSTAINNPFNYSALTKLVSYGQRTKVNMNVLNQEARNPGKNFHPVLLLFPSPLTILTHTSPKFSHNVVGVIH